MSACAAPLGSPCRTGEGEVAIQHHTTRFRLVPQFAKALNVPPGRAVPRGQGSPVIDYAAGECPYLVSWQQYGHEHGHDGPHVPFVPDRHLFLQPPALHPLDLPGRHGPATGGPACACAAVTPASTRELQDANGENCTTAFKRRDRASGAIRPRRVQRPQRRLDADPPARRAGTRQGLAGPPQAALGGDTTTCAGSAWCALTTTTTTSLGGSSPG